MKTYFERFEDKAHKFRWRLVSNKSILCDSGQGYSTKSNCRRAIKRVLFILKLNPSIEVHDV